MWPFSRKGPSGFSWYSTAEEVTQGVDGSGLTAIVTGGSSGIGAETTRVLALHGVHVVMAVRNVSAGNKVKHAILMENPTCKIDVLEIDLSSFASIRKFVVKFETMNLSLNILINNAAVLAIPFTLSQDGIEMQFATNHLGHFLLTNLLLENMKATSSNGNIEGRIVNVSSWGHKVGYREGILFDKINDESMYNKYSAYGHSKLCNILHANELSRHLKEEGINITANSVHPGVIMTNLLRHSSYLEFILRNIGNLFMKTIQQGAATTCYVALNPQVSGISGEYFSDNNIATCSAFAQDTELAKKLWDFSAKMIA